MKTVRTVACGLLCLSLSLALAQGEKDVHQIRSQELTDSERGFMMMGRAEEFLRKNQLDDAIAVFQEAIRLQGESRFFDHYFNYPLAKALALAGRNKEALAAFKKSISWDPVAKELYVLQGRATPVAMDYAICLAKCGMDEEAKALYYFGLSKFNQYGNYGERFPFLVVFEPEYTMTVWDYAPEKLVAAATMAKAPFVQPDNRTTIEEAHKMEPDWIIPVMYLGSNGMQLEKAEYFSHVRGLAQTELELSWIRASLVHVNLGWRASLIRSASTVLNKAKRDLENIHSKIATTAKYPTGMGNDPRAINFPTPEIMGKVEKARSLTDRGELFQELGMYDEAIALLKDAIQIEKTLRGHGGSSYHELAKALAEAGCTEEALAVYKQTVFWDPIRKELNDKSTSYIRIKLDYAILLAKFGKVDEAKMVYYSVLRTYNKSGQKTYEPYPFLIVFDPDPTMTVWEYTTGKFVAAALMLRSMNMSSSARAVALAGEVGQMEPTWIVPVMVQAIRAERRERAPYIGQAMSLARNEEEREWIRRLHDGLPHMIGRNLRMASAVLNAAKLDLELNHHKIAVCGCEGGH